MPPEISNQEAIKMMSRCKHEIVSLKATISRLQPKAEAYDNIASVLSLLPRQSVGMSEDLIFVLDKRIRELTPKPAENTP